MAEANPFYPELGVKVARLRRGHDRKAHGEAVLEAIRRLQRSDLNRETPSHNVHCASGTNNTTGKAIIKAIQQQHRGYHNPDAIRKARSIVDIRKQYEEAMEEKRNRSALPTAQIVPFNERRPSWAGCSSTSQKARKQSRPSNSTSALSGGTSTSSKRRRHGRPCT